MNKILLYTAMLVILSMSCIAVSVNGTVNVTTNFNLLHVVDETSLSPFIIVDTPTAFSYSFEDGENTVYDVDGAWINIYNSTYNLTFNPTYNNYQIVLLFNSSDVGALTANINGTKTSFNITPLTVEYQVVEYAVVGVDVWENRNQTRRHDDKNAYLLFYPDDLSLEEDWLSMAEPIVALGNWMDYKLKINTTKIYESPIKVFWAEYETDSSTYILLPKNQVYSVALVGGTHYFYEDYYSKFGFRKQEYNVQLDVLTITEDVGLNYLVEEQDIALASYVIRWAIWLLFIMLVFLIPILIYIITDDAQASVQWFLGVAGLGTILVVAVNALIGWLI